MYHYKTGSSQFVKVNRTGLFYKCRVYRDLDQEFLTITNDFRSRWTWCKGGQTRPSPSIENYCFVFIQGQVLQLTDENHKYLALVRVHWNCIITGFRVTFFYGVHWAIRTSKSASNLQILVVKIGAFDKSSVDATEWEHPNEMIYVTRLVLIWTQKTPIIFLLILIYLFRGFYLFIPFTNTRNY